MKYPFKLTEKNQKNCTKEKIHSSLKLIKERDYVNKLFNRFIYKNDAEKMDLLKEKANSYLNVKLQQ